MSKRTLTILIAAVLVVGAGTAALAAALGGGDDAEPMHTLEGGKVHTGPMPSTTPMPGSEHQMEDGQMMPGEQ
jgi:hypothetical protein